ncbi:MAG TPA: ATP-binding protein [Bryobacteraceae bacterium]|nr:ATP-binding protein [Bryobacteraceae bacterium]
MHPRTFEEGAPAHRIKVLLGCALLAAGIAAAGRVISFASLGILYIVPLLISAAFLPRWAVLVAAVTAAALRENVGPTAWDEDSVSRFSLGLVAFVGAGLFVSEMVRRRKVEADSLRNLAEQSELRREAEEDARVLIESSPAAIITVDPDGSIDLANEAAKSLLGLDSESLAGRKIADYFPMLGELLNSKRTVSLVRTMVESSGRRNNGEMFYAHMWLSNYKTAAGTKLALVVADISEQLRDREEVGLRQLLMNSRIIAGAVSHEIRNLAAAAEAMHDNIGKSCGVGESEDFHALGRLIEAMRKLSSSEMMASAEQALTGVDLNALLKELNVILASGLADSDVELRWEVAERLPHVRADHSGLLQILLNLAQNSRRAVQGVRKARITVSAYQLGSSVMVCVSDNGPGVSSPETLFQPFQHGAASTGLGLYVSRALVRTYGGELQYAKRSFEGSFVTELPAMVQTEAATA